MSDYLCQIILFKVEKNIKQLLYDAPSVFTKYAMFASVHFKPSLHKHFFKQAPETDKKKHVRFCCFILLLRSVQG